jgi:hypothetical protein
MFNQTPCLWILKLTAFFRALQLTTEHCGQIRLAKVVEATVSSPHCSGWGLSLLLATLWVGLSAFAKHKPSSIANQNKLL